MKKLFALLLLLAPTLTQGQDYQIEVTLLKDRVYIYQSYADYQGNKVGANGLIIESEDSVIVVDTPWNNNQTQKLITWVEDHLKKPIAFFVITHAHDDRIGGISLLKEKHIKSISGQLTAELAPEAGFEVPDITFEKDTVLQVDKTVIEIFYPGPGHTTDNVAVYIDHAKVLYGGCFLKSAYSKNLGNIADADIKQWPKSIHALQDKFPKAKIVIPGHGGWEPGAIENTLQLLETKQ